MDQNDWFTNIVASILILAQFPIYLPQYLKIYRRGYSQGHHSWFMFMTHTASLLAWINALIYYIHSWHSYCVHSEETKKPITSLTCLSGIYGLVFFWLQWLLQFVWYLMYLSFLGPDSPEYDSSAHLLHPSQAQLAESDANYACRWQSRRQSVYFSFLGSVSLGFAAFIITLFNLSTYQIDDSHIDWHNFVPLELPPSIMGWSYCLEIITMILFAFCYLPQLYEIVRLAQIGSYSLLSQSLMIPSNLIWTIFLANWSFLAHHHPKLTPAEPIEPPTNTTFNTSIVINTTNTTSQAQLSNTDQIWLPYLVMTGFQMIVLGFGIYYEYFDKISNCIKNYLR